MHLGYFTNNHVNEPLKKEIPRVRERVVFQILSILSKYGLKYWWGYRVLSMIQIVTVKV